MLSLMSAHVLMSPEQLRNISATRFRVLFQILFTHARMRNKIEVRQTTSALKFHVSFYFILDSETRLKLDSVEYRVSFACPIYEPDTMARIRGPHAAGGCDKCAALRIQCSSMGPRNGFELPTCCFNCPVENLPHDTESYIIMPRPVSSGGSYNMQR
jgi:hypothetical protein